MNFKSLINDDRGIFLNLDEYADWHLLNNTSCRAIVQDVVINESLYPKYGKEDYRDGVYAYGSVINVRKEDLPKIPTVGMVLLLDKKRGQVVNVADDMGILTITWTAHEV